VVQPAYRACDLGNDDPGDPSLATAMAIDSRTRQARVEHDSLGPVDVPADKLWGAQTQRSLEHFSIGDDLMKLLA
jgi:hypothetical protein